MKNPILASLLVLALSSAVHVSGHGARGAPLPLQERAVPRLHRLSSRLYSGAEPEGEAGFTVLRELRIRTLISVDGKRPDAATARRFGIRTIHLPIGYDGIDIHRQAELAQAFREAEKPIFVHCHHGRHRGPAAAAILAMSGEAWSRDRARAWLGAAGTSHRYSGLFRDVDDFDARALTQAAGVGDASFSERAPEPPAVATMVAVGEHWDRLKESAERGFGVDPKHPDVDPAHEALMLAEALREAPRTGKVREQDGLELLFLRAAKIGEDLERALREGDTMGRRRSMAALKISCLDCHARYRDSRSAR